MSDEEDEYLGRLLAIDPLQLNEAFTRLPAELAYATQRASEALSAHLHADLDLDRAVARLSIEWRETLEDMGDKRPTEAQVKAKVESDQRYIDARVAAIEAEVALAKAKGIAEAVRAKRDMVVSLGAAVRAELEGQPSLRAQHRYVHGNDD
jgi:hypothetical protein